MRPITALFLMHGIPLSACATLHSSSNKTIVDRISESASWQLGPGNVGELTPGEPIPESVYQREGRSFQDLWLDQVVHLNEMDLYTKGFRNQSGDKVVNFPNLDVRVSLDIEERVTGIWVGNNVRTDNDIGVGSSLAKIEGSHQGLKRFALPEPYHCAVESSSLPGVMFYFRDHCNRLDAESTAVKVLVLSVSSAK